MPADVRELSRTSARRRDDVPGQSETAVMGPVEGVRKVTRVRSPALIIGTDDPLCLLALLRAIGLARRTLAARVSDGFLNQVSKIVAHGHLLPRYPPLVGTTRPAGVFQVRVFPCI